MRFQEAFELGKRYFWPFRARKKAGANGNPPPESPNSLRVYPAKGIINQLGEFAHGADRREASFPGAGRIALLMAGRRETDLGEFEDGAARRERSAVQKLLDSFPIRKNVEWNEYFRRAGICDLQDHAEHPMEEIFVLTKKILSKILGPLDFRVIRDVELLESALEKVHPQLPISFRLILRKKRYIEFMMDNRERLVS